MNKTVTKIIYNDKTIIISEKSDPEIVKLVNKVIRKLERSRK